MNLFSHSITTKWWRAKSKLTHQKPPRLKETIIPNRMSTKNLISLECSRNNKKKWSAPQSPFVSCSAHSFYFHSLLIKHTRRNTENCWPAHQVDLHGLLQATVHGIKFILSRTSFQLICQLDNLLPFFTQSQWNTNISKQSTTTKFNKLKITKQMNELLKQFSWIINQIKIIFK